MSVEAFIRWMRQARGDLMGREAGGVYELRVEVAIAREVGERARHRRFVAQARANVSLDAPAQLVLAGDQGDDPELGVALLDRQPPEYLVDDSALVHDPAEDDVLVRAAAQEVAE